MTYPLIGITTYGRNEQGAFALPGAYIDAVRRAGGIPLLIPPGEKHLEQVLAQLDGVIFSGGGDLDPAHYNGANHETIYMTDSERDRTELELAQRVAESDVPTLGICRGIQVLNVALGGTLIEHLPDEVGEELAHRLPPRLPSRHLIHIDPGSRLAGILDGDAVDPTSWHHQAIRQAAPSLRVVAHAPDGTVEAIELPNHPWFVGVQWHPEITAAEDAQQQRLFDALVAAARQRRAQRNGA
jgi:putative glutamine amidotransferase